MLKHNSIWCEEVIINTTKTAGKGIENDPVRLVVQVFTKEGELIAEYDHYKENERSGSSTKLYNELKQMKNG
jgi:hypothetical protein